MLRYGSKHRLGHPRAYQLSILNIRPSPEPSVILCYCKWLVMSVITYLEIRKQSSARDCFAVVFSSTSPNICSGADASVRCGPNLRKGARQREPDH